MEGRIMEAQELIKPDAEDFREIARLYPDPRNDEERAHLYRLAQARKLIRAARPRRRGVD